MRTGTIEGGALDVGRASAGGVVVRASGKLQFVPSAVAVAVLPMPELARLPGAPEEVLGIAVHRGEAIPVLAVSAARSAMIVCSCLGEEFGLVGLEIVATGRFPSAEGPSLHGERVVYEGEIVLPFDVAAVFARAFGDRGAASPASRAG